MWDLLTGTAAQRLVCFSGIGLALSAGGLEWNNSLFWCILVLVFIVDWLADRQGATRAADYLLSLPRENLIKLKDGFDGLHRGEDTLTVEEINELMRKDNKDSGNE